MENTFICEYARTNTAVCRGCETFIAKRTLRIAIMLQGMRCGQNVPNWYHFDCFFIKHMPHSAQEIENFALLKWDDQQAIQKIIKKGESPYANVDQRPNLKRAIELADSKASVQDYTIEFPKGNAKCKHCENNILRSNIRVSRKMPKQKYNRYHFDCFVQIYEELEFFECGSEINGFDNLSEEDQAAVKKGLPGLYESLPKKIRLSTDTEPEPLTQQELTARDYNIIMLQYRNDLKANLKRDEIKMLLNANGYLVYGGPSDRLDMAMDMLTYGALAHCPVCNGKLAFSNLGYKCTGASPHTKCHFITKEPIRNNVIIPFELSNHKFLREYEYIPRQRIIGDVEIISGPLKSINFYIHGFSEEETTALTNKVKSLAGRVVQEMHRTVFCVISNKEQVQLNTEIIQQAKEQDVYVVSEDFLNAVTSEVSLDAIALDTSLVQWGSPVHQRIPEQFRGKNSPKLLSVTEEEEAGKRRLKIKNFVAIEPDSELENSAHVYQDESGVYNANLIKTDITTNTNLFYKIQLLKSDTCDNYWLYKNWGRVGAIGCNRNPPKKIDNLEMAIEQFEQKFLEMTGNIWENRFTMEKRPHQYMFVDVDYRVCDDTVADLNNSVADSSLQPEVAQLMAMIFNVQAMEKMMLEYELDLIRMPLGRLSRRQIKDAYNILTEISFALQRQFSIFEINEYTNKFYSYMPSTHHSLNSLPLINNKDIIQKKSEMLANLLEMETAFTIIRRGTENETENILDAYYRQLNAAIEPLEKISDEFKFIQEYVTNTHAAYYSKKYDLKILEVFKVARDGEKERYDKFNSLHNRRLLWHGSQKTNFAGIISQGLRIAPPEAPSTGSMFGKGIYFADMVSKSANYCSTSPDDSEGLVLLCEVALGNMIKKYEGESITELPENVHSVWGVGRTEPDPSMMTTLEDGTQVPLGKPVNVGDDNATLYYNEYIVYDVSQVRIKYLVKLDFLHKN